MKSLSCIFPCPDIIKTANFYKDMLGFTYVQYLDVAEPHICLYRDNIEIILLKSNKKVIPNRILYGYGYDAYVYTDKQDRFLEEFKNKGVKIIKDLSIKDYNNKEFVIEDFDGRHIAFGLKITN